MIIRIIVPDQKVIVIEAGKPQRAVTCPNIDWNCLAFKGDPSSKSDDVRSIEINTETDDGFVSYHNYPTRQKGRPPVTTPDWLIDYEQFESEFGFVLPAFQAELAKVEAEEAADAERVAALMAQANEASQSTVTADSGSAPPVDLSRFEAAMTEKDAAIAEMQAKLAALEGKVGVFEDAVKEVSGGGT